MGRNAGRRLLGLLISGFCLWLVYAEGRDLLRVQRVLGGPHSAVEGTVVEGQETLTRSSVWQPVAVTYAVDKGLYRLSDFPAGSLRTGAKVRVLVSAADPSRAILEDGALSGPFRFVKAGIWILFGLLGAVLLPLLFWNDRDVDPDTYQETTAAS